MKKKGLFYAILAAALYALNSPCSKQLLGIIPPTMMAGLLYLGAGIGMFVLGLLKKNKSSEKERKLDKSDIPYTIGMVLLDIMAPVCLMYGLSNSSSANVSLLNNFEIVATSIIALFVFKESISKRLWLAIGLVTVASLLLSFEDINSLKFSYGSIFVLLACVCWGFENNFTKKISDKNPIDIVVIKGFCSGLGSLIIAFVIGERVAMSWYIFFALLLGFVAYGLSIYFYIYAQRFLGAAKTSTFYAVSPFIGVGLSLVIFGEIPSMYFWIALTIMALATILPSENR